MSDTRVARAVESLRALHHDITPVLIRNDYHGYSVPGGRDAYGVTAFGPYDDILTDAGVRVSMSDADRATWAEITAALESPEPWQIPAVYVPYTTWGDYGGSMVERANHAALRDDDTIRPYLRDAYGDYSSSAWIVPLAFLIGDRTGPHTAELRSLFSSLADYPSVDDEALSMLEWEQTGEDVDSFLLDDITHECSRYVAQLPGEQSYDAADAIRDALDDSRDSLRAWIYELLSAGEITAESETAVNMAWHDVSMPHRSGRYRWSLAADILTTWLATRTFPYPTNRSDDNA